MMKENKPKLETLVSLAKRRGFVFQASEIYGGLSGFWDYGPYGSEMVRNIKKSWWDRFVNKMPNIHGIDSAIIQNPKLWEASGHTETFNDPMVDCKQCKSRLRADHVIGEDTTDQKKISKKLNETKCPVCGTEGNFTDVRTFNLMFKTYVGPLENEDSVAYLRPETAGGIFTNFKNVQETARAKVPFGIAQIGKAYRNERSPRDFIFRLREFEQMEIEYFVEPKMAEEELSNWREYVWQWLKDIGINEDSISWHQHNDEELSHYADEAWDIQFDYPFGEKELWGIANRTDYDLKAHSEASNKDLRYFDQSVGEKYYPYVIEPSIGIERLFLALLTDAYHEEEVEGDKRVVLKLSREIAPVKVAVLPLVKNNEELVDKAESVFKKLLESEIGNIEYDESGSIGKRYRRQDEIGTPHCVTIDFDTLDDNSVTIRERDSMEQKRVLIDNLVEAINKA